LLGLLACPGRHKKAIDRGIEFLLNAQQDNGEWIEPEWTGTGFPRHFYLRYDYYRLYFPVWAFGRYVKRYGTKSETNSNGHA
jgi:squalene-hopene/tetraprenyl-beta-curcumene cyclase